MTKHSVVLSDVLKNTFNKVKWDRYYDSLHCIFFYNTVLVSNDMHMSLEIYISYIQFQISNSTSLYLCRFTSIYNKEK